MPKPPRHGGWGTGYQTPKNPEITQFEKQVKRLGLQEHEWRHSIQLKAWVSRYKHHRFVPEDLLIAWGMHDDDPSISDVRNS